MTNDTENDGWCEVEPDVKEEMESAVEHVRSQMSDDIKLDINRCNSDLYFGPLYLDANGDGASYFDEGATQFDFTAALKRVRAWAADIKDIRVEIAHNPDTGESLYDRLEDSAKEIVKEIIGNELYSML